MSRRRKGFHGGGRQVATRKKEPLWLWVVLSGLLLAGGLFLISQLNKSSETSQTSNYAPAVTGRPQVAVSQDKIDYGDVKLGQTINTVFNVRNVGDQNLVVQGEPQVEVVEGC